MSIKGKFQIGSAGISAACAVCSLAFTVPSTISSYIQLNESKEKLTEVQAILDQTKVQADASSKDLEQIKRVAAAGEGQLDAQRQLKDASVLQAKALNSNAKAAALLVKANYAILEEARRAEDLRARPVITFTGMRDLEMVQGKVPAVFVLFSKTGTREPTSLTISGSWKIAKFGDPVPDFGHCSPSDRPLREFGNGSHRASIDAPLSPAQFDAVLHKQSQMTLFGRLCYDDGTPVRKQVNYCVNMHPEWTTRC